MELIEITIYIFITSVCRVYIQRDIYIYIYIYIQTFIIRFIVQSRPLFSDACHIYEPGTREDQTRHLDESSDISLRNSSAALCGARCYFVTPHMTNVFVNVFVNVYMTSVFVKVLYNISKIYKNPKYELWKLYIIK